MKACFIYGDNGMEGKEKSSINASQVDNLRDLFVADKESRERERERERERAHFSVI